MTLSSKERAALRGEAHHLTPTVHVGHLGVTPTLRGSLDDALRTRVLVKIQFSKNADVDARTAEKAIVSGFMMRLPSAVTPPLISGW